jgi:cytochrome c oxidase cbb3-type subunit IV
VGNAIFHFLHSLWSVWVMVLFIGIVTWVYWPKHKSGIEAHGQIPLRDDENEER